VSQEQTKTTDEGPLAVYRVGRNAAPVFRESLEDAIRTAKAGAEQSGGEYLIFRVLGSVRAEAHWAGRSGCRAPARAITEVIETHLGRTWEKRKPEPERDAEKVGPSVNPACWTRDP